MLTSTNILTDSGCSNGSKCANKSRCANVRHFNVQGVLQNMFMLTGIK